MGLKIDYNYNTFTDEWEYLINDRCIARIDNEIIYEYMLERNMPNQFEAFKLYMAEEIYNRIQNADKFIVEILINNLFK